MEFEVLHDKSFRKAVNSVEIYLFTGYEVIGLSYAKMADLGKNKKK